MSKRPTLFKLRIGASHDELTVYNRQGRATVIDRAANIVSGNRDANYKARVHIMNVFRAMQRRANGANDNRRQKVKAA